MFRRWYVSVPVFLVAIGATLFVATRVEPDYVATSYVQLVPPAVTPKVTDETKASARNPWLDLGPASLTKAGMISVQDQSVAKQLKKSGYSDNFTLTQDAQMPIVTFEVIGEDEAQARRSSEQLVRRFSDSVTTLQKAYGAPTDQMFTAHRLDLGDNVEESTSKVKRALIAVAGVGMLLAVALTVAIDAWLRRRARRRAEAGPASGEPSAAPQDADEAAAAPATATIMPPKRIATTSGSRSLSPYNSESARRPASGEETAVLPTLPGEKTVVVLSVPPSEDTIVLPSPTRHTRNGHANGSQHP